MIPSINDSDTVTVIDPRSTGKADSSPSNGKLALYQAHKCPVKEIPF